MRNARLDEAQAVIKIAGRYTNNLRYADDTTLMAESKEELSRLVIAFLPRSKHLLISWLQSPSVVILEPKKIKSDTVATVSPSISHEVTRCHDLRFLNVEF